MKVKKVCSETLGKSELQELERMSNEKCKAELKDTIMANRINVKGDSLVSFNEAVYVRAKITIMKNMLQQSQKDIAIRYLKKVIFGHNRNYRMQALLLERAAKLMLVGSEGMLTATDFTK